MKWENACDGWAYPAKRVWPSQPTTSARALCTRPAKVGLSAFRPTASACKMARGRQGS